jgi:hypothetical protein
MVDINKDFPIFNAVVTNKDGRNIFSAFAQWELVSKLAKAGIYNVDIATESNSVERYCIEITADINLDLFRIKPKLGFSRKRDGECMYGADELGREKGVGRFGPFGA